MKSLLHPTLAVLVLTPALAFAAQLTTPAIPAVPTAPATVKAATPLGNATASVALPADLQKDIVTTQTALTSKTDALTKALGSDTASSSLLSTATSALSGGKYADALASLTKLSAAKLTPDQMKLVGQVRDETTALVLQKGIAAPTPALAGPVHNTVTQLRAGDYTGAVKNLTALSSQASLTPAQKSLLSDIAGQYAPALKSAAGAASQALGSLQGLGLGGK